MRAAVAAASILAPELPVELVVVELVVAVVVEHYREQMNWEAAAAVRLEPA
jgi:hypothetical protein